jgi:putative transposase
MDAKAEKLALFRCGLIAPLLEPLARRAHAAGGGNRFPPIQHPRFQTPRGQPRAITPQRAGLIERLKHENPHSTGTTLLRELALSSSKDEPLLSASTLYRFLKQCGLSERQLLGPPARQKFEAELANQIWQADMLLGPWVERPGGGPHAVFLHATLDDARVTQ